MLVENKSPYHIFYDKDAVQYSAYIQDKMEYSSMIMNVGLRYDAFVPNDSTIANLIYPEADKKEAKTKTMVSPRIGVSLPITDKGIFHFLMVIFTKCQLLEIYIERVILVQG